MPIVQAAVERVVFAGAEQATCAAEKHVAATAVEHADVKVVAVKHFASAVETAATVGEPVVE